MPEIHVARSVLINAPAEKVYPAVADLTHMQAWSPWLIMEPEARVEVKRDGLFYEWEGKRVGSGNMEVTDSRENKWVNYDLTFLKPWKSTAKVRFELKEKGENSTEATWYMDSSLPFFMFWMKKQMEAYIGMDYTRGLNMLKEYVEDGEVHSKLLFGDRTVYPGCEYVGIHRECPLDKMGTSMEEDFTKLGEYLKDRPEMAAGNSFSIYHNFDMVNEKAAYTAAIPVAHIPSDLPDGMTSGSVPETEIMTVTHVGPYQHLGNAWSTLYSMERNKEFKQNKKTDPFEVYRNTPGEAADEELITEVNFPVK
ncbi:GyrI-like domain-containing protein [Roseivirga sp. BDSF3-8]|uniref:SRPBCC family protein n=1 Tax=Roseivirga sp. BDSF3-8 TaxID=3241598 RepID=UPI003531EA0F